MIPFLVLKHPMGTFGDFVESVAITHSDRPDGPFEAVPRYVEAFVQRFLQLGQGCWSQGNGKSAAGFVADRPGGILKQIKGKLDDAWQSVTSRWQQRTHGRPARFGAAAEAGNSYEMINNAFARPSHAESYLLFGCKRVLRRCKPSVATLIHFPELSSAHVRCPTQAGVCDVRLQA